MSGNLEGENPVVSVIIPTWNRGELVLRAVTSVLNQSYQHLEAIVVDDGSTDDTPSLIRSLSDERVRFVSHPNQMGGDAARNTGLAEASGAWIALLDSDDQWLPQKLDLQLTSVANADSPEIAVSYTQVKQIGDDQVRIRPGRAKRPGESVGDYLFVGNGLIQSSTFLIAAPLMRHVGFRPDLHRHTDYDLALRLERAGAEFFFVADPVVLWNTDSDRPRVSTTGESQVSLDWLTTVDSQLSPRAVVGFQLIEVLPRYMIADASRVSVLRLLILGIKHRLLGPRRLFWLLVRLPFSRTIRLRVKQMAVRLRR